jgi:hypothetical protein
MSVGSGRAAKYVDPTGSIDRLSPQMKFFQVGEFCRGTSGDHSFDLRQEDRFTTVLKDR